MADKRIKDLGTTITDFRTGDYIVVDGTDTAKMGKNDLLARTAENAVNGVYNSGNAERINGGVVLEYGSFQFGEKTASVTTRARFSAALVPPFSISLNAGYIVSNVQKCNSSGFVSSSSPTAQDYSVTTNDGMRYCVVVKKSDDSAIDDLSAVVASFDYTPISSLVPTIKTTDTKAELLKNRTDGVNERLNSGAKFELGGYVLGRKAEGNSRMRVSVPLIPPFSIKLKAGFVINSSQKIDNDGNYVSANSLNTDYYEVTTNDGLRYCVQLKKTDGTDFDGTEDVVDSFDYTPIASLVPIVEENKNVNKRTLGTNERLNAGATFEIGSYGFGVKTTATTRMRSSVPLIPPFSIYLTEDFIISSVQKIDNDGNYVSFSSPTSRNYAVTANDGNRYCIVISKNGDPSYVFDGTENVVEKFEYAALDSLFKKKLPDYNIGAVNVFARVGVIGDSYAEGWMRSDDSEPRVIMPDYSWPAFMQRKTGRTWTNFAKSGSSCKTWVNNTPDLSNRTLVETAGQKCQAYVIGLQLNDRDTNLPYYTPPGTIADAGTDADTYCAYLYKLIKICHDVNNDAKIFVFTLPQSWEGDGYNAIVRQVCEKCKTDDGWKVYCVDLFKYYEYLSGNPTFVNDRSFNHYTPIGYEFMQEFVFACMSITMCENESDFKNVYKIPYDVVS